MSNIALSVVAEGLDHSEDIAVAPDGRLYAGGEAGQIYEVDLDAGRVREVGNAGGFLLGITFDGNGRVYACDIDHNQLMRVDLATGDRVVRCSGTADRPLVNPNKGVFLADGSMLLTSSGHWHEDDGCIFRVSPDGETTLWSDESRAFPNGACLDRDGGALLIAESTLPGVSRIPIGADGSAGPREVVAEIPGSVPDGVGVDVEERVYVCCYRPDRVYTIETDGTVEVLADDPEGTLLAAPTNCTWAGAGRERFVVANFGRWHLTAGIVGPPGVAPQYPTLP